MARSWLLSLPKFIPEPVVPTFVFAPLFAGVLFELLSVMRWFCASTPLPCPKTMVKADTKISARKQSRYFIIQFLIARETGRGQFENSPIDRQRQERVTSSEANIVLLLELS